MTDELKRCPFCGGEPKVFYHNTKFFGETVHIECLDDNCGCGTCHHDSKAIAVTVWNRRTKPQAAEIEYLRELLAAAYIELSGKEEHASDCATSNAPAMMPGRCDCD